MVMAAGGDANPALARLRRLLGESGVSLPSPAGGGGRESEGASAAAGARGGVMAGTSPEAFDYERHHGVGTVTIEADDLYSIFDPGGFDKSWTVKEVARVADALPIGEMVI